MMDEQRRKDCLNLLKELDAVTMKSLKAILAREPLSDLDNYLTHALNTVLENNRAFHWALSGNFSMLAGASLRNLLESWANTHYILRDDNKKDAYASKITSTAIQYSATMDKLVQKEVPISELYELPKWTASTINQRVGLLGEGPVFQYELLSRYTHADMWASINDVIADKPIFWTNLFCWGLEFINHNLYLIYEATALPDDARKEIEVVSTKVQALVSPATP